MAGKKTCGRCRRVVVEEAHNFPPLFFRFPPPSKRNFKPRFLSSEYRVHTHTHTLPQPVATCGNFPPQCNSPRPSNKNQAKEKACEKKEKKYNGRLRSSATLKFRSAEIKVDEGSSYGRTLKARRALGSNTEDLNSQRPLSPPLLHLRTQRCNQAPRQETRKHCLKNFG